MVMRFKILGSSSSGNAALLITDNCKVLIDAGFSARRLGEMLEDCGESIDAIDAVFLTHEHGDHTSGIRGLSRLPQLKIFANHATAKFLQDNLKRRINWKLFETGTTFQYRDLEISTFVVPHDACDPVGFVIHNIPGTEYETSRSIGWVLDLGYIPQLVRERVRGVDLLVIEANHDIHLLDEDTHRPWSVKQRIKGRHGHLSNDTVYTFLNEMKETNWKDVHLAHLSKDCNSKALLNDMFSPQKGFNKKFSISVIDPTNNLSPTYHL